MCDVAGGSDDQMIGRKPGLETRAKGVAIEFFHRFRCAEYRPPERMPGPKATRKNLVEKKFGVVQVHLDFFEDDLALFLQVLGIELRAKNEIGNDVEGNRQVLVENLGIEADLFFGGESVEHAADRIHFAGD